MRKALVLLTLVTTVACAASPTAPVPDSPDPAGGVDPGTQCFTLHITGKLAPDVTLPRIIQLTREPAPNFLEPGRLAVREPNVRAPRAPISWWRPTGPSSLELVLGGGYTGYSFSLTRAGADWAGQGTYFADIGLLPAPEVLGLRLNRQSCP